jgi:hypothetical protein
MLLAEPNIFMGCSTWLVSGVVSVYLPQPPSVRYLEPWVLYFVFVFCCDVVERIRNSTVGGVLRSSRLKVQYQAQDRQLCSELVGTPVHGRPYQAIASVQAAGFDFVQLA